MCPTENGVASNVLIAPSPAQEMDQVAQGQWTPAYGRQIEQSLAGVLWLGLGVVLRKRRGA